MLHGGRRTNDGELPTGKLLRETNTFIRQHRIYLSEPVCKRLEQFTSIFDEPVAHAFVYGDPQELTEELTTQRRAGFRRAFKLFPQDVPIARTELEIEFRDLLGSD